MRIDLHLHTEDSFDCGTRIEDIMLAAKITGMSGICITDHNVFSNGRSVRSKAIQSNAKEFGLIVMRGCEVSTDLGHFLCYGLKDDSWNTYSKGGPYIKAQTLINQVNAAGGAVVAAHPFRGGTHKAKAGTYKINGHFGAGYSIETLTGLAGIEAWNGGTSPEANAAAAKMAARMNLITTGGSDAHLAQDIGRCWTRVPNGIRSMWDLLQLMRRRSPLVKAGRLEG